MFRIVEELYTHAFRCGDRFVQFGPFRTDVVVKVKSDPEIRYHGRFLRAFGERRKRTIRCRDNSFCQDPTRVVSVAKLAEKIPKLILPFRFRRVTRSELDVNMVASMLDLES